LENLYLVSAATLGRRTAELHLTLAHAPGSAFAPEPLEGERLEKFAHDMRSHADSMLRLLEQRLTAVNEVARPHAERVLANRASLLNQFDELSAIRSAGAVTRIHGDYHLGQVLRTEEDFVILDFEGEPARPIAERRAKQSPLKDIAGMMRSYHYAAYAALFAFTVHAPDDYALLEPWADTWQHWAAEAFLAAYKGTIADNPLAPHDREWAVVLRAFVLDKALYELGYELNNRPDWVRIPLIGILKLIS
jgi:maltose alpha-D-glucosyltransferase/alpha-amylase